MALVAGVLTVVAMPVPTRAAVVEMVAADELGEGIFGMVPGVARQQLKVRVAHLQEYIATVKKPDQKKH